MKFYLATLSLALASASVKATSLRAAVADNSNNNNNAKILDSEVILKGTVGEPTAEDMEFIGKALVASYNNVHWEVGHYMTGSHAVDFKGPDSFLCRHCPDDDSMGTGASATSVFEVKTPVGFLCRHCPDDDAMGIESLLMTAVTEDCAGLCKKEAAAELEVNFCNKIRSATGSEYLSSAKSCAIRFDANEEKKRSSNSNKRVSSATNTVATVDSTIILKGVGAGDATKEEQAILAKAFVSAYNDVHWGANHYLTDAEIPFTASTGSPDGFLCRHCPDDDAMGGAVQTNTLVLDIVSPVEAFLCRHCPDDDAMGSNFDIQSLNSNAFDKKAVEVAFCSKIQKSTSKKLASTKSCSIAVESVIANNAASAAKKSWCKQPPSDANEDSTRRASTVDVSSRHPESYRVTTQRTMNNRTPEHPKEF
eukprot:jgi/Psemu1/19047/gm1.19047_g